jgi:AraC family transcriptional regulator, regulatory protein of adaptative response / DNA-3-methyladenine glycosylase II
MPKKLPVKDWDVRAARRGELDGRFLVGSMTQGTYSLPSCAAPLGRHPELIVFSSEAMAKAAGLRPCKVCRPDRFHATQGNGLDAFRHMRAALQSDPSLVMTVGQLADTVGLSTPQLDVVMADHAQLSPDEWLERERLRHVAWRLLTTNVSVAAIGEGAGFPDNGACNQAFTAYMRMSPSDYRAMSRKNSFQLSLPAGYRTSEVMAYQGRDPEGLAERSDGRRILKALGTEDGPAVLEITFAGNKANIHISSPRKLGPMSIAKLHRDTLKILGLENAIDRFEATHADLVGKRQGLRVPLIPSAFDALAWAIVGQQINVSFASSLRRELIVLAGEKVGDMIVHPTPAAVANLDPSALTTKRFSRSKAKYLIDAAQAISGGQLDIESLADGSAIEAEALLTAQHGVGTWTARYVMMRTGFADAAPVGDSGLATALERLYALPERPDAIETARLMMKYAPWRSLASVHLWASLSSSG